MAEKTCPTGITVPAFGKQNMLSDVHFFLRMMAWATLTQVVE